MNAPIYVTPPPTVPLPDPPTPVRETTELLRQLVGIQQEQLGLMKAQAAGQDGGARWRAFLARWADEFPGVGLACKEAVPALERAYLTLVRDLTDRVNDPQADDIDNEFALSELLDRYGIRLGQLGNILAQLGPLADAAAVQTSEDKG